MALMREVEGRKRRGGRRGGGENVREGGENERDGGQAESREQEELPGEGSPSILARYTSCARCIAAQAALTSGRTVVVDERQQVVELDVQIGPWEVELYQADDL